MRMNVYKYEKKIKSLNIDCLTDLELKETMEEEALLGHKMDFELIDTKGTATFLGWQETPQGDPIAVYNVKGGKLDKSTVVAKTLRENGIV